MSKNMFEEPKNQNIFDSLQFKNMHHNENDINLLKKSYQQSVFNATYDTNNSKSTVDSQSLTQIQETSGKAKSKVQIQEPHENAPAMFKIALKIKKLTEEKILKKTPSEESGNNSVADLGASQELKPCLKKTKFDGIKLELSEDNLLANEIVEFELDTENIKGN